MKQLQIYEKGEMVYIKAEVRGISISGDNVTYSLYDPKSGHDYDLMYKPEELFPVEEHD